MKIGEDKLTLIMLIGSILLSLGISLSILNPKGISAVTAMLGSLLTFGATVALIIKWIREG